MERAANGLTISAELYGETGKHIAHIGNGQLHVMTNENVRVARDGDLSNLIVTDEFKNELLYIRYMNATTMRIRGIFGCPGHGLVRVTDNEIIMGAGRRIIFSDPTCFAPGPDEPGVTIK